MLCKYLWSANMAKRAIMLISTLSILIVCCTTAKAASKGAIYGPTVSASIKLSQKRQIARMGAVIPLLQNPNEIFYGSIIGMMDAQKSSEGNIGLGWRSRVNPQGIIGLYGFMDFRRTPNKNIVSQLTFGTEWLVEYFEGRANLYLPLNDTFHSTITRNFVSNYDFLANISTFESATGRIDEVAMMGCDFEVGGTLPAFDKLSAYSAYYFFSHPRVRDIHGVRVRANLALTDWCAIETEVNYDATRGFMPYAGITLSWNNSKKGNKSLSRLEKKMTQLPVRDIDIVTSKADPVVYIRRIRKTGYIPLINTAGYMPNVQGNNIFNSVTDFNASHTREASDIAFFRDASMDFGFVTKAATLAELNRIDFRRLNERKICVNSILERCIFGGHHFGGLHLMDVAARHLRVHAEPIRLARIAREYRARQQLLQRVARARRARADAPRARRVAPRQQAAAAVNPPNEVRQHIQNGQNTSLADTSIRQSNNRLEQRYLLNDIINQQQNHQRRGLRVATAFFEGRQATYYQHIQNRVVNARIVHNTAHFAHNNPRKYDARYNDELASELAQFALDRIADGGAQHAYNNIRTDVSLALVFTAIMDEDHIAIADRGDYFRNLRTALVETTREYNRNHNRCRIVVPQPGNQPARVFYDDRAATEAHQTSCAHGTHNKIIETLDNPDGNGHPDVRVIRNAGWAVTARAQELANAFYHNYEQEHQVEANLVRQALTANYGEETAEQDAALQAYQATLENHLRPLLNAEFVVPEHVDAEWLTTNLPATVAALEPPQ